MLLRHIVLVAVCFLASLAATPARAGDDHIPSLTGTWEAVGYAMHDKAGGFASAPGKTATMVIKEQQGRVFHGEVAWTGKRAGKDTFSGVIDKDGDSFYFVGHNDALRLGKLEGPDALVFYYLAPGGANPRAGYVEYRRVSP